MKAEQLEGLKRAAVACYRLQGQAEQAFEELDAKISAAGLDEHEAYIVFEEARSLSLD